MRLYFIEVRIYFLVLLLGYILFLYYYFNGEKLNKGNNIRKIHKMKVFNYDIIKNWIYTLL